MVMPHAGLVSRENFGTWAPAKPKPEVLPVHAAWSAGPKNGTFDVASVAVSSVGLAAGTTALIGTTPEIAVLASDDVPT